MIRKKKAQSCPCSKPITLVLQEVDPGICILASIPRWFYCSSDVKTFLDSMFPWAMDQWDELSPSQGAWVLPCPFLRTAVTTGSSPCPTVSSSLLLKAQAKNVDDLSELPISLNGSGPFPHCTRRKTEVRGWRRQGPGRACPPYLYNKKKALQKETP